MTKRDLWLRPAAVALGLALGVLATAQVVGTGVPPRPPVGPPVGAPSAAFEQPAVAPAGHRMLPTG